MKGLFASELRRVLHRRVVWGLVAVGTAGIALFGVIAFTDSSGRSVAEMRAEGTHPALMAGWWVEGSGDGILTMAAFMLVLCAVIGAASVVGGEWRAGTITTVLTWEPRRTRVHVARLAAGTSVAMVIALVVQAVYLAAFLPAVVAHGSTEGVDGAWWIGLVAAMLRISVLTGLGALLSGSLATLGRAAAFALAVVFVWVAVVENLLRGWKPAWASWLVGENMTMVVTWGEIEGVSFTRSPGVALATILVYSAIVAVTAGLVFARRDVGGAG